MTSSECQALLDPSARSDCSIDPLNLGGPYRVVREAVDHAERGDIVLVRKGHYPAPLTINKRVELRASRGAAKHPSADRAVQQPNRGG